MERRAALPLAFLVIFAASAARAQDSPDSFQVRREIGLGIRAFRQGQYEVAAQHFEKACQMDPESINPRLYLGTSYASLYNPSSADPANLDLARKAEAAYLKVLELNPEEDNALRSLASLAYQRAGAIRDPKERRQQFDRAAGWYRNVAESMPKDKGAFYMLGVIAWDQCDPEISAARAQSGLQPESAGPIPDAALRARLKTDCGPILDDGMAQLKKALDLDPDYEEAYAYLNLLTRERANFADSLDEWKAAAREADQWSAKALQAQKNRAAHPGSPEP